MKKPIITFLTGIPGTGKTTTANALQARCEEEDLRIHFYNDYPFLIKWAENNRGDESKVRWFMQDNGIENFDIIPKSYPEMSQWIAREIAAEIADSLGKYDVVVLESARGAGEGDTRDRYDRDLFYPVIEKLGDKVQYVNVEMVVRDLEIVLQRMEERLRSETNAAPPFVAKKYVTLEGQVQSAFEQASQVDSEGETFALNEKVDNSDKREDTLLIVEGIVAQVMMLNARENRTTIEGQSSNKEQLI